MSTQITCRGSCMAKREIAQNDDGVVLKKCPFGECLILNSVCVYICRGGYLYFELREIVVTFILKQFNMGLQPIWNMIVLTLLLLLQLGMCYGRGAGIQFIDHATDGMVLSTTNGKALYLYKQGAKHPFPDFHTFTAMGFNSADIQKMRPEIINKIPDGKILDVIIPPPAFRADDYMYHNLCEDYPRLVNDLGVVANLGDMLRWGSMFDRVHKTKSLTILALGGSITAGGYFESFIKLLSERETYGDQSNNTKDKLNVKIHNHGHGATEIIYTLFCIEIDLYQPDIVLIDFSVNDYGHPKLMDALIRKTLQMGKEYKPVVALVNLWVQPNCPTTKYLTHAMYYNLPLLNLCPAVDLCYGKGHLPKWRWEEYSKDDGVHPWGKAGVPFIGEILYAWYKRSEAIVKPIDYDLSISYPSTYGLPNGGISVADGLTTTQSGKSGKVEGISSGFDDRRRYLRSTTTTTRSKSSSNDISILSFHNDLPPPLFGSHIGQCTRCDALASDSTASLTPVEGMTIGFEMITRVKIGFGGFNPTDPTDTGSSTGSDATKSFKKSWQADKPGDTISFKFYGSSVSVAMWQRRDSMGVLEAKIDNDNEKTALASGFFKGFTWAMEKNNTGRSEVVPLFEGLDDKEHLITFRITETPANKWVPGHICQIFALLSASDDPTCKQWKHSMV